MGISWLIPVYIDMNWEEFMDCTKPLTFTDYDVYYFSYFLPGSGGIARFLQNKDSEPSKTPAH